MLLSWLSKLAQKYRNLSTKERRLARRTAKAHHFRPWLEPLEDRTLPSGYGPPSALDLTAAGATANNGATSVSQSVSADGRYAVFASTSTNLNVSNFTGTLSGNEEVYLRDLVNGTTTLVSISPNGQAAGDNISFNAVISADGRYVAFTSAASNLVTIPSGDHLSFFQLYVWDRTTGTVTLASPADDTATTLNLGGNNTTGYYTNLSISNAAQSSGGVVVAFDSYASDLDPAANVGSAGSIDNIYAYNVTSGNVQLVSLAASGGGGANANAAAEVVSADGTTVAFTSTADNLDPNATVDTSVQSVYARKLSAAHVVLVSAEVNGNSTGDGTSTATGQAVSADGRYEVFSSNAYDLINGVTTDGQENVYLRDRTMGTITLVSAAVTDATGKTGGDSQSFNAVISADGRYVAFTSAATDLVTIPSGDHLSYYQLYVWDRTTGKITLASPADDTPNTLNLGANSTTGYYTNLSISNAAQSSGGVVVAFDSYASDLDPAANVGSTGSIDNIYAYNVTTGKVQLVSLAASGGGANASAAAEVVSADGTTVAFTSTADNLDPNATVDTSVQSVYARKLSATHVVLVSAEVNGNSTGDGTSTATSQAVSADGRYEVFSSYAYDLINGITTGGQENVYLRDRTSTTGTVTLISAAVSDATGKTGGDSQSFNAVISADGRYVAFTSAATDLVTIPSGDHLSNYQVYVWDRTTGKITLASQADDTATTGNLGANNTTGYYTNLSISDAAQSGGGVVVAFDSYATDLDPSATVVSGNDNIYAYNVTNGKVQLVSLAASGGGGANANAAAEVVSADGTTVAFTSTASNLDPNATVDTNVQSVYARKLSSAHVVLVSGELSANSTANGTSTATGQAVSADGQYEVFTSYAYDLINGITTGGQENVYLRDRTTGAITLVSAAVTDPTGLTGGNSQSFNAVISADGRYVAFTSAATDLVSIPNGDHLTYYQVYLWDRTTGKITLASPADDTATTLNIGGNYTTGYYTILSISNATQSSGGVVVAFDSYASDLDPATNVGSAGSIDNIYAYNVSTGKVQLVSLAASGGGGANGSAAAEVVSADGTTVAFTSTANNLDPNATVSNNSIQNIYARKLSAAHVVLVSIATDGVNGANGNAYNPVISSTGQYVAFDSYATNLNSLATSGDYEGYVRDLTAAATTLLSVDTAGTAGANNTTQVTSISGDGSKVALESTSTDLTAGVTTGYYNIYVRSWQGGTPSTVQETPNSAGTDGGDNESYNGVLSADGSTIAFVSAATDLINGTTTAGFFNVYVKPLGGTTVLASPGLTGTGGNASADTTNFVSLGLNGTAPVVVFNDNASNLVAGDNNGTTDVFDFTAGTLGVVSAKPAGTFSGNANAQDPVISANGQYVAFSSYSNNLTATPNNGNWQGFVRDLNASATTLLSFDTAGTAVGNGTTYVTSISGDGSKVALESSSTNLSSATVTTGYFNIYVRSWQGAPSTVLETPNSAGTDGGNYESYNGVLSADGSTIAFVSGATDLVNGTTTSPLGTFNVYVKPLGGTTVLASPGLTGTGGNASADTTNYVSLGLNGTAPVVVFNDNASNLVAGDNNGTTDVFDFTAGTLGVVSAKPAGTFSGNANAQDPVISANGQYVAFSSYSNNLTATPNNGNWQGFVRDLNASATTLLSFDTAGTAVGNGTTYVTSISGDGSKVALESSSTNLSSATVTTGYFNIYVRSWQGAPSTVLETPNSAGTDGGNYESYNGVLSADGSTIAFVSGATDLVNGTTTSPLGTFNVYVKPLGGTTVLASPGLTGTGGNASADTTNYVSLGLNGTAPVVVFNDNASNLVAGDNNGTTDVFDFTAGTLGVVSAKPAGIFSGNGYSYDPVISANGQFIAFDGNSDNLVTLPTGGGREGFVRDLNAAATTLLSVDAAGTAVANNTTYVTSISGDGSKVALESDTSNLTTGVSTTYYNIYVRSWQGATPSTVLETPNSAGTDGGDNESYNGVLSADGSTIAFVSAADDLISGTTTVSGVYNVYVKPLGGTTVLASPGLSGTGGNANADTSNYPAIDYAGDTLVYNSNASNLVANDNNGTTDVFVVKATAVSISSFTGTAPSSGTTTFPFVVVLNQPITQNVTVNYATADGTAHQPGAYLSTSRMLTFTPGGATSQTINVTVNGTTTIHPNETFFVNLTSPTNASIGVGTGTGTILTNDTAPVANPDSYTVNTNATLTVAAPGVLANDTDFNTTPLTAINFTSPSHGGLSPDSNGDGGFVYTPNTGFTGTDTFTYQAYDGILTSSAATVTINVAAVVSTTTAVTSNPTVTFSGVNQPVTLTAHVSGSSVPTGSVVFTVAGLGSTSAVTVDGSGNATTSFSVLANTTAAQYVISAAFTGTGSYSNSSSTTATDGTLTVNTAGSATAAQSASATFSSIQQSVTLTASVTSTNPNTTVNEGTVTFTVLDSHSAVVGTATQSLTVSAGQASVSYQLPAAEPAGSYTIQAVYNPGPDFTGSGPVTNTLTINPASNVATTVTLSQPAAVTFSTAAQSLSFSATVTSANSTTVNEGTVTFTVLDSHSNPVGTAVQVNVVNGAASTGTTPYSLPAGQAAGTYTVEASFSDGTDYTGNSDTKNLVVNKAATTTAVTSNPTVTASGSDQNVDLTASVTSGAGTVNEGTVTFSVFNGTTQVGTSVTATVVSGVADTGSSTGAYVLPGGTAVGSYSIDATYNPAATAPNFTTSSSSGTGNGTLTVQNLNQTTTAVTSDPSVTFNFSTAQPVTLSAHVGSGSGVPTGSVIFTVTSIGSTAAVTVDGSGNATTTFNVPADEAANTYLISAAFTGTGTFSNSTSSGAGNGTLTVNAAATTTSIPNPATVTFNTASQSVNLTAFVQSTAGGTPTGSVLFTVAGITGSATATVDDTGHATGSFSVPGGTAANTYLVSAAYTATVGGNYTSSSTTTESGNNLIVNAAATTTTVTSNPTVTASGSDQNVDLTASVISTAGTVNEGTVTFSVFNGTTQVGTSVTATVVSGVADTGSSTGAYVLPGGTAAGSYSIDATYNPAATAPNFTTSSSSGTANGTLTVQNQSAITTTTAVTSNPTVTFNFSTAQPVTLSAHVSSGSGVPTGSVIFTVDGLTPTAAVTVDASGNATTTFNVPADEGANTYTIAAAFTGTGTFANSNSSGAGNGTLRVNAAATTTSIPNPATVTFNTASQSVNLTAFVQSTAGGTPTGSVLFTVAGITGSATATVDNTGHATGSFSVPGGTAANTYLVSAAFTATVGGNYTSSSTTTQSGNNLVVSAAATTTAVTSNPTVTASGSDQNVDLTASVTSSAGTVNEGTVTFSVFNGTTQVGSSVTANVVSGVADTGSSTGAYVLPGGTAAGSYSIDATYNPAATGPNFTTSSSSGTGNGTLTVQTVATPAAVTNLTSTLANGSYTVGTVVPILVTFSHAVFVTGTPQLALNSGGTASYVSGSGTATLTFSYTVAAGQNADPLDAASTSALTLNGGTIVDAQGANAVLTVPVAPTTGALGVNTSIVIDTVAPTVTDFLVLFGTQSYSLVTNAAALAARMDLPWQITGFKVVFTKAINAGDANSVSGVSASGFSGLSTNTLTWTFSALATASAYNISLLAGGADALKDAAGNALANGTNYTQAFKVLVGDVNGDGVVNSADMVADSLAIRQAYNIFMDVNGDGVVDINDVLLVRKKIGTALP